jgi:hypothetical protein
MPNMSRIRAAQESTREATRQKKLRDTPVPVKSGKTTAAQYSAAYGTALGGNEKLKAINKRAYMVSKKNAAKGVSKLMSTQSASVVPDDETAKSIKAKRKTGTVYAAARFKKVKSKKTGKLGSDVVKNPEEFEAEYQASGTGKAGDTFEAMKTKKKGKLPQSLRSAGKTGKRRARAKSRERAIEKKPKTKKTKKTKNQKDLEAAYGSPKDTERMMKGKPLKESLGSKLKKKFGKGK